MYRESARSTESASPYKGQQAGKVMKQPQQNADDFEERPLVIEEEQQQNDYGQTLDLSNKRIPADELRTANTANFSVTALVPAAADGQPGRSPPPPPPAAVTASHRPLTHSMHSVASLVATTQTSLMTPTPRGTSSMHMTCVQYVQYLLASTFCTYSHTYETMIKSSFSAPLGEFAGGFYCVCQKKNAAHT